MGLRFFSAKTNLIGPICRYSSVNEDSPSSYLPYAESLPTPTRSSYQVTPSAPSYSPYNNNIGNNSSSLRQSLSSSRLNNNNSNAGSNGSKYGRLSRHFSFDSDANEATPSYMSPESYVTLTRHRSRQGDPSVVEKYFSSTMSPSTILSRQASASTLDSGEQSTKLISYPVRPSPARYVSSLSKSSSSGNANA